MEYRCGTGLVRQSNGHPYTPSQRLTLRAPTLGMADFGGEPEAVLWGSLTARFPAGTTSVSMDRISGSKLSILAGQILHASL